jgi:outer membrane protein assembly factor BamB
MWRGLINPVVLGPVLVAGDAKGYAHLLSQSDGKVLGRERWCGTGLDSLTVQGDLLYTWSARGRVKPGRSERPEGYLPDFLSFPLRRE